MIYLTQRGMMHEGHGSQEEKKNILFDVERAQTDKR